MPIGTGHVMSVQIWTLIHLRLQNSKMSFLTTASQGGERDRNQRLLT